LLLGNGCEKLSISFHSIAVCSCASETIGQAWRSLSRTQARPRPRPTGAAVRKERQRQQARARKTTAHTPIKPAPTRRPRRLHRNHPGPSPSHHDTISIRKSTARPPVDCSPRALSSDTQISNFDAGLLPLHRFRDLLVRWRRARLLSEGAAARPCPPGLCPRPQSAAPVIRHTHSHSDIFTLNENSSRHSP
jgi:hypothetical protein